MTMTVAGGEINCLDPAGYGPLTITKSLTIKCGPTGGILVTGTDGIVIQAAATDKVTLVGLDIFGFGSGTQTSVRGIWINSARSVQILDTEVSRFQEGVMVDSGAALTRVHMQNVHIHDDFVGVIVAPASGSSGNVATIRSSAIVDNTCNLVASSFGLNNGLFDWRAATSASGRNIVAQITVFHSAISDATGKAVLARGGNAIVRLGANDINGNTSGLNVLDGGKTRSFGDKQVDGTGPSTVPTVTVPRS